MKQYAILGLLFILVILIVTGCNDTSPFTPPFPGQDTSSFEPFKYYNAVSLGMTKADVDKAIGLEAIEWNGANGSTSYVYTDNQYGVLVDYNKSMKVFGKSFIVHESINIDGSKKTMKHKEGLVLSQLTKITMEHGLMDATLDTSYDGSYEYFVKLFGCEGVLTEVESPNQDWGLDDYRVTYSWGETNGTHVAIRFEKYRNIRAEGKDAKEKFWIVDGTAYYNDNTYAVIFH